MSSGQERYPPGAVVESTTHERRYQFIKLEGTWDLVNRNALTDTFGAIPRDVDVVLDIQEVAYCDSTIVTEVIILHRRLRDSGRRLDVVLGSSPVRRLFSLMHLDKVLGDASGPGKSMT